MNSDKKELADGQEGSVSGDGIENKKTPLSMVTPEKERVMHAASSENEYESEPASLNKASEMRKRKMNFRDGKTMHPKVTTISPEVRELAKKQLELEKNLKIEGLSDHPKPRKRRMSLGSNTGRDRDATFNSFKRKRLNSLDTRPKKDHMPKWGLLGGDATDPLNLNGLATSEEGRLLNLKTPENSPLPTPEFRKVVYVKVPPNIEDPLNLEGKHDQRVIDMLLSATRKKRHRSKKNKDTVNQVKDVNPDDNMKPSVSEATEIQDSNKLSEEQVSNPKAVNQIANVKPRSRSLSMSPDRRLKRQLSGGKGVKHGLSEPKKFPEKPKFTVGNYDRYYGYRNQDREPDPRLRYFNPHWFDDKDVLDIGCNVGHVTLALAEHFSPRKVLGMDIDGKLIGAARQNIRHMLSQRRKDSSKYPSVFEITRGPLEAHPLMGSSNAFPNNVLFLQGNYVPGNEEILQLQKEEYDTILALSITKWIHLNNGDHGLKLFFRKIYKQLRPGGRLILEPQPWTTYRKRAKLSPELFKNYSSIKLKPEGFKNYLLSIGFVKCEVIGVPVTKAKGFRRPLILFTKTDNQAGTSSQQNPTGSQNNYRVCTECSGGDQTFCDHIQFTGMRQGAYADRLYDHISYRSSGPVSSESSRFLPFPSPLNSPVSYNFASRRESPFIQGAPYYFGASPYAPLSAGSRNSNSNTSVETHSLSTNSSSGSGSQSYTGSERSWTDETSGCSTSGSSSSYSQSSRGSVNNSNNGPVNGNGEYSPQLNGDIAADIQWVDNENANMEFENQLPVAGIEENNEINNGGHLNGQFVNGHLSNDEG